MNEYTDTAKWLKYLLYVGIAGLAHYLLNSSLPGFLSAWMGYAITGATVYLMFRLIVSNARYKKAMLFYGAALILNILGIQKLALAASICTIVGHFQEYYANGELVAPRNPRLANKWNNLFWFQCAVEVIGYLLITGVISNFQATGNVASAPFLAIGTVAVAFLSLGLKIAYLLYLSRTVKELAAVVE